MKMYDSILIMALVFPPSLASFSTFTIHYLPTRHNPTQPATLTMKCTITSVAAALLLAGCATAFTAPQHPSASPRSSRSPVAQPPSALFMGRAAAVRAATKGKTDAKKAKVNAYYGKKIIMAVKAGGSADPNANRQLAELIKAAKNNSVPMDVSACRFRCYI